MTYDDAELRRYQLTADLAIAEAALYTERERVLPMKDNGKFSSELSRKVYMDCMTATRQASVDGSLRELEILADRAHYLIATERTGK